MAELAERIVRVAGVVFGYEGKVVQRTSPDREYLTDNPSRRCPTIQKANRELGYHPRISLDEGLRRSLIWYGGNQDNEEIE
jgi:nucleoside-diphosphate-sugar epimerase